MCGTFKQVSLLAFFMLFGCIVSGQTVNDLKRNKLKGDVTSVAELEYSVAEGGRKARKDSLRIRMVTSFDSNGNAMEFVTYSPDDKVQSRSVYEYDKDGNFIEIKRYKADGSLHVTTKLEYDRVGNIVGEENYDPSGGLFMTTKGKYVNGNRIVYDRFGPNGHLFLKSNYKFDKKGNEIEEREFDSHHGLKYTTTYKYSKYDKKGNWLRKVVYKNKEPRTIIEREITY